MKILIVAGGTGGHLYPGLSVARVLASHDILFVVRRGDLGRDIVKKEGFAVAEIAGQGLPRSLSIRIFTFPFKFLQGWAEAWALLRKHRPDWVLGMGGYLSVPVIMTARLLGIRTLLHEQNVLPGLANRFLSRWVNSVAVSFPDSTQYLRGKNVWVSGLPIRPDIGQIDQTTGRRSFGLDMQRTTFLVFGGSLGAQHVNTAAIDAWPLLLKKGLAFQVLHVTGTKDFERVEGLYRHLGVSAKVMPYCHTMAHAYAAADAVICRAGASTVTEVLTVKRPALLVPYPYASNNHQVFNARIVEKSGLGRMVLDKDLNPSMVASYLEKVIADKAIKVMPTKETGSAASRLAAFLTS